MSDFLKSSQRLVSLHKAGNTLLHLMVSFSPAGSYGLSLIIIFIRGFQETGFYQCFYHTVRVTVGSRTSVLKVPTPLLTDMVRDANTNISTGCGGREFMKTGSSVSTGEAPHVVSAIVWIIGMQVLRVTPAQPSDCFFNVPVISQRT